MKARQGRYFREKKCKSFKYSKEEQKNILVAHKLLKSSRKNYTSIGRRVNQFMHNTTQCQQFPLHRMGKDVVKIFTNLKSFCPHVQRKQSGGGNRFAFSNQQKTRMHFIQYLKNV